MTLQTDSGFSFDGLAEELGLTRRVDSPVSRGACDIVYPAGCYFRGKVNETIRRKPHYYFSGGRWWCARVGRVSGVCYDLR